jgi:hypothetical protein
MGNLVAGDGWIAPVREPFARIGAGLLTAKPGRDAAWAEFVWAGAIAGWAAAAPVLNGIAGRMAGGAVGRICGRPPGKSPWMTPDGPPGRSCEIGADTGIFYHSRIDRRGGIKRGFRSDSGWSGIGDWSGRG